MILRFRFKYKYLCAVILLIVIFLFVFINKDVEPENCLREEPIDVVYTWVNGTDHVFLNELNRLLRVNVGRKGDSSKARYTDRYELKFSLRSLEKYAPWIRNVYIVTNGQIPYWLNLDYEKVYLVTHEEIFTNPKHLPSFSSPAIETHLHRIPGISRRFLYFNDDIYLGAPVYKDDFVSKSHGIQVYFDYPLQSCADDCPWLYVHDGQCDKECNVHDCQMDGGDCDEENGAGSGLTTFATLARLRSGSRTGQRVDSPEVTTFDTTRHVTPTVGVHVGATNGSLLTRLTGLTAANITSAVREHNRQVMLVEKLRRKKMNASRKKKRTKGRRLRKYFDAYKESLQYTNRLFNVKYGFMPRYVPAHMPFLIDVDIMEKLQTEFRNEFYITSRNKVRSADDIQFSFSYFYYVIHERIRISIEEIFDMFDTDRSKTWSDREIRTILTKLYELPLNNISIDEFDSLLVNCSKLSTYPEVTTPEYERYIDSRLPTISKDIIVNCDTLKGKLMEKFGWRARYNYEIVKNVSRYVSFEMIKSDIHDTVIKLDKLRQTPRKFVCLNDNMNNQINSTTVNALWYDFYLSLFPNPSKFELPVEFRNRFLYVRDLRSYHFKTKLYIYFCIIFLSYVTICILCKRKLVYFVWNKIFC